MVNYLKGTQSMELQNENKIFPQEHLDSIQNNEFFKKATELFSGGEWKFVQDFGAETDFWEFQNDNDNLWIRLPEVLTFNSRIEVTHYRAPQSGHVAIWEAAVKGQWDIVKQWIERDPSLIGITGDVQLWDYYNLCYLPLFHLASMLCADVEVLKYLVSHGADVNAEYNDSTPLHYAAWGNADVAVLQCLISLGVDVNAKDRRGSTPLYVAVSEKNSVEILKYLVSQGADVNAENDYGGTPLNFWRGVPIEIAQFLVSQGADIHVKNENDETPLHHTACVDGNLEVAKYLVSLGADVHAKAKDGSIPLHLAAREGRIEITQYLVSEGADVNAKDEFGNTPLHDAILNFNALATKFYLFEEGEYVNEKVKNNFTSFYRTGVKDGNIDVIKFLVSQGADVHAKNAKGETPLHYWAVRYGGNVEVGEFFISKGADVNAKDNDGVTPLHGAAYDDNDDVVYVKYLVFKGADMNAKDNNGETPLHWAASRYNLYKTWNRNYRQAWQHCREVYHGTLDVNTKIVKFLVSAGADVNAKNKEGKTSLDVARDVMRDVTRITGTTVNTTEVVKYLLFHLPTEHDMGF